MSFTYLKFGSSHTLPTAMPKIQLHSAPILSSVTKLPGGGFYDGYGSEDVPESFPYDIAYSATYFNPATPYTHAQQLIALQTFVDQAKALTGTRNILYRSEIYDSLAVGQWCYARLKRVQVPREVKDYRVVHMTYIFEILTPWYGLLAEHGANAIAAASPYTASCPNGGNRDATDIVFEFTVGGSSTPVVTKVIVDRKTPDTTVYWEGTLADGEGLRIDFGEKSVETVAVGGAKTDAYGDTTLTTLHRGEWLVFEVGANAPTVSWLNTGTVTPDILFTYYDRWA